MGTHGWVTPQKNQHTYFDLPYLVMNPFKCGLNIQNWVVAGWTQRPTLWPPPPNQSTYRTYLVGVGFCFVPCPTLPRSAHRVYRLGGWCGDLRLMFRATTAALQRGYSTLCRAPQQFMAMQRRMMSIHLLTRLEVADNSGAKEIMCIGHHTRKPARIGDCIRAVVKKAKPRSRVSRKDIVSAVIVRQRARHVRADGTTIKFQENTAVILKRDLSGPIATRVSGPVARELRQGGMMKVLMMASRAV